MLLHDMLLRNNLLCPHKEALVDDDVRLTFRDIHERSTRLAAGMRALGIKFQDHIAVVAANGHQFVECYFAASMIGCVIVPINTSLTTREIAYIVEDSQACSIIVSSRFLPKVEPIIEGSQQLKNTILIGEGPKHYHAFEQVIQHAQKDAGENLNKVSKDDILIIMYTSGTTGSPKGVCLTHTNIMLNTTGLMLELLPVIGDNILPVGPLFHIAAVSFCLVALSLKAKVTIIKETGDPLKILSLLALEKISFAFMVPAMLNLVINTPDISQYDLSALQCIVYGTAPLPRPIYDQARRTLNCGLIHGYGLTESTATITLETPGNSRLGSAGPPIWGVDIKIVDDNGLDLAPGKVGEIITRTQMIMKGYWNKPGATREAVRDGWLYSGDLGYMDQDGFVFIVDRKKDMINTGGENVYPREVENQIRAHDAVADVAVIGIPDQRRGEIVKAFIVPCPGQTANKSDITKFLKERLAPFKIPKKVVFIDQLPKTSTQKVQKEELKKISS